MTYAGSGWAWPVVYGRGQGGEVSAIDQFGSNNTLGYDPAAQVTSASSPSGSYGFDAAGNPTSINGTTQAFDSSGELCWSGTGTGACGSPPGGATTYSYDQSGDRTSAGSNGYSYDGTRMMTSSTTAAGTTSYSYSPDGLRVSKSTGSATTPFVWDATGGTAKLVQDGGDYCLYGPDGLPYERIGSDATRYLFCDGQGSVTASTDSTGTIVATRTYDAWGNVTGHTGTATPVSLGWRSQYQDSETGFSYLRARCYDPATGQFTTPDPMYALTGSRYGFAYNDPVNGEDPTGMCGFLGNGPCTPGGIAKEATNDTIRQATGGTANCIRGVTCARSTKSAYVSDQQAADFAGGVLNGITGGVAKDAMPGLYGKVNLHSGFGWAGWGVGVGASLVAAADYGLVLPVSTLA